MKRFRNLIAAGMVIFLFTGGCGKKEAPKQEVAKAPESATQAKGPDNGPVNHKVLAFNLEGLTEKGAKKWDVKGESAEAISENEVKLDNIVASAYGEEAEAVITADKGVYDRAKNNVRLEQNVHATIDATQGFSGGFIDGAKQKPGADKLGVPDAKGKKKSKTIITCDGEVQFDYEKNQAFFLKNVKVVNEDGVIDADKITVFLDPATRRLKNIVADGNVKITRGDNTTFSQQASYSEDEKKVTLSGKPKLILSPEGGMGFDTSFIGEAKKK